MNRHARGLPRNDTPLQLAEVLDFRPDQGIIRLHEQRVVILSAAAMGLLRKELVETLGVETARRLLVRFGFADGYHDAVSLRDRSAWTRPEDGLRDGAELHTLEGIVRAEVVRIEHDRATGRVAKWTFGTWFRPVLAVLAAMRRLRGTPRSPPPPPRARSRTRA